MRVEGEEEEEGGGGGGKGEGTGEEEEDDDDEDTTGPPLRGPVPELEGKWASCLRVMDTSTGETVHQLDLQVQAKLKQRRI